MADLIPFEKPSFMWDKDWVRPYESFFSIMRNFCLVNAVSGLAAPRLLGYKDSNPASPKPDSKLYVHFYNSSGGGKNAGLLLPEWYVDEYDAYLESCIYQKPSVSDLDICICPLCERDHYHSYLHQIPGLEHCPFHRRTRMIHTRKPYLIKNISSTPESLCGNAQPILPFQRKKPASFYRKNVFENFGRRSSCVMALPSKHEKAMKFFDFIAGKEPSRKWTVSLWNCSDHAEMKARINDWIASQELESSLLYQYDPEENNGSLLNAGQTYYVYGMYCAFIFVKVRSLLSEFSFDRNSLNSLYDEHFERLCEMDFGCVPAIYCWFTLKMLRIDKMFFYASYLSSGTNHAETFMRSESCVSPPWILYLLDNAIDYVSSALEDSSGARPINAVVSIIEDYFDMLWKQITDDFRHFGKYTVMELSEHLCFPEYHVFENDDGNMEIWRYDRDVGSR